MMAKIGFCCHPELVSGSMVPGCRTVPWMLKQVQHDGLTLIILHGPQRQFSRLMFD
jgi:hypothetical protein